MAKRIKLVEWTVWVDDDGTMKAVETFMHAPFAQQDPATINAYKNANHLVYGTDTIVQPTSEGTPD